MEEEATAGRQDWWQVLAVELKQHIWSHLDAKDIIMATAVCLEWRNFLLADQHQPWAIIFQRFFSPLVIDNPISLIPGYKMFGKHKSSDPIWKENGHLV